MDDDVKQDELDETAPVVALEPNEDDMMKPAGEQLPEGDDSRQTAGFTGGNNNAGKSYPGGFQHRRSRQGGNPGF